MTSQPPIPPSQPDQPAEAVPTCYRHPGRETWVRCQRCDRPICPDCMRDASVGFQCPECVAEGNKGMRQARSTFGGAVIAKPYVTYVLLGLLALVFVGQLLTDEQLRADLAMNTYFVAAEGQFYRMITSAFVHSGYLHLGLNAWAIYAIGPYLEQAFGHARYLALYLLSALGGSVLTYWFTPVDVFTLGASGAVFGLFSAVFLVGRKLKIDVRGIVVIIVLNLVMTFVLPAFSGINISWTGHVGGLIVGAIVALGLAYPPKSNRNLYQVLALLGVFVALVVLVTVKTTMLLG